MPIKKVENEARNGTRKFMGVASHFLVKFFENKECFYVSTIFMGNMTIPVLLWGRFSSIVFPIKSFRMMFVVALLCFIKYINVCGVFIVYFINFI